MPLKQPDWARTLSTPVVVGLATLGPIGRRLPAPGTWGSVAGLLLFSVIFEPLGPIPYILLAAVCAWFAVGICGEAELRLGRTDPGEVILDECVAMPFCLLGWSAMVHPLPLWVVCLLALAVFRFFDILKPLGINALQKLPGGWGVVVDDLAAALATCAVIHFA